MGEGVERYDHQIIAYCLMSNHVHLAVRAGETGIGEVFHNLLFRYAQRFNTKHKKTGHLFEGRFKSKLVGHYGYMRSLIRYIHLNPVRAKMVGSPQQYRWSSHQQYVGEEQMGWLSSELGLECFGEGLPSYREFLRIQPEDDEWFDFDRSRTQEEIGRILLTIAEELGVSSTVFSGSDHSHQSAEVRAAIALVSKRVEGITLTDLADYFGQTPAALSKSASRLTAKLATSPALQDRIDRLCKKLAV